MIAVRHPTMTSLYLLSHYTTGMRTASTMCSILVPPCCGTVQHQCKTEGLLLCVHSSSKTTWHRTWKCTASLCAEDQQEYELPINMHKNSWQQVIPCTFFFLLCQWQIAKVATQAKEQYLRSLQDNEPQIHISSGSRGLSSSLILKNEDQVRSNQPGILDFSQTWTEFCKTGCISYKCPSCPFAATQDQLKKKNKQPEAVARTALHTAAAPDLYQLRTFPFIGSTTSKKKMLPDGSTHQCTGASPARVDALLI